MPTVQINYTGGRTHTVGDPLASIADTLHEADRDQPEFIALPFPSGVIISRLDEIESLRESPSGLAWPKTA